MPKYKKTGDSRHKISVSQLTYTAKKTRFGFIARSTAMKGFVSKNRPVLIPTYNLIRQNTEALKAGKTVVDRVHGIRVRKAATGPYKGRVLAELLTLKVQVAGKELFVKQFGGDDPVELTNAAKRANNFLRKKGFRFAQFRVKVVEPLLIYHKEGQPIYVVTNFFNKGEVKQAIEVRQPKALGPTITELADELEKIGVFDVSPINAFYHRKKNTILLFDLGYRESTSSSMGY